jgi:hypothetical protein
MPPSDTSEVVRRGSGKQAIATTMAFVRLLKDLMRDQGIGARFVPIIPDEARTFGMDSLFPTAKIYNPAGQQYISVDRELVLNYQEAKDGQILHEGINEAGSVASFIAAGSSYSTSTTPDPGPSRSPTLSPAASHRSTSSGLVVPRCCQPVPSGRFARRATRTNRQPAAARA